MHRFAPGGLLTALTLVLVAPVYAQTEPGDPGFDTAGPQVTVHGLPKKCLDGKRRFRVHVKDQWSKIGAVKVYVDRRLMRERMGGPPNVIVHKGKLGPGRHRLRVIANDASGNQTRRRYPFDVCR